MNFIGVAGAVLRRDFVEQAVLILTLEVWDIAADVDPTRYKLKCVQTPTEKLEAAARSQSAELIDEISEWTIVSPPLPPLATQKGSQEDDEYDI